MKSLKELGLDQRSAEEFTSKHACGDCGGRLTVAYGGAFGINEMVIRCGKNKDHNHFGKIKSERQIMEENMANEKIGLETGNNALAKVAKIQPLMNKLVLSQSEAITILKELWLEAPDIEIKKAAAICALYRLNPLMKHLFLVPFIKKELLDGNWIETKTWSTVIGITATRLMASRKYKYSYMDGPRLMSKEEQELIFGTYDPGILVVLVRLKTDAGMEAPGYGTWQKTKIKTDYKTKAKVVVGNEPQGMDKGNSMFNMAAIRAERQAFARLCPQEMPEISIEVVDETYQDLPNVVEGHVIDVQVGETAEDNTFEQPPATSSPIQPVQESVAQPEAQPAPKEATPEKMSKELSAAWGKVTKLIKQKGIAADVYKKYRVPQLLGTTAEPKTFTLEQVGLIIQELESQPDVTEKLM